jgi:uncharacterized protein with HEPN domain
MKRHYRHFLEDIVEYSKIAESFVENLCFQDFQNDTKTFMATVRAMEIVG